jgi:hypothetical protein
MTKVVIWNSFCYTLFAIQRYSDKKPKKLLLMRVDAEMTSPIRLTSCRSQCTQSAILDVSCIASDRTLLLYGIFNAEVSGVTVFFSQGSGPHGRGNGSGNYSSSTPRTKGCGCLHQILIKIRIKHSNNSVIGLVTLSFTHIFLNNFAYNYLRDFIVNLYI